MLRIKNEGWFLLRESSIRSEHITKNPKNPTTTIFKLPTSKVYRAWRFPGFEIFKFAQANGLAVVTFDPDFVDLNAMYGTPPKIVYLNTGNLTTRNVSELLTDNILKIHHYLNSESDHILELIKAP